MEIDKVQSYAQRALVGRIEFVRITRAAMLAWMREAWVPVIGYTLRFTFLLNGWCSFHFLEELDAIIILRGIWLIKHGSLMLSRWYVGFDPIIEPIKKRHLWLLMPGFPIQWWKREIIVMIVNTVGRFLFLDDKTFVTGDRKMVAVLVELNVTIGLPEEIEITCGSQVRV